MNRKSEIKVLPSMMVLEDGQNVEWNPLESDKREVLIQQIGQQIGEKMGLYFASKAEEWEIFLKGI